VSLESPRNFLAGWLKALEPFGAGPSSIEGDLELSVQGVQRINCQDIKRLVGILVEVYGIIWTMEGQ
jgi:hypothetical protein